VRDARTRLLGGDDAVVRAGAVLIEIQGVDLASLSTAEVRPSQRVRCIPLWRQAAFAVGCG
jgi:hypothetical protein